MSLKLSLVVAMCSSRGIGVSGTLPWKLKGDMSFFKKVTSETKKPGKRNVVIMGRKTWDSIPTKMRPLRNRINVVISRTLELPTGESVHVSKSFEDALKFVSAAEEIEDVFIIGGSSIYEMALRSDQCYKIYLTEVHKDFQCDVFFPDFDTNIFLPIRLPGIDYSVQEDDGIRYSFKCYQKICSTMDNLKFVSDPAVPTYAVAAMEANRGIAYKNNLPWPSISKDVEHYLSLTRGVEGGRTVVICGRKTWDCMGWNEKNLSHVLFIVVSNSMKLNDYTEACSVVDSFEKALCLASDLLEDRHAVKLCYLGGKSIYQEAIEKKMCKRIYLTRIFNSYLSDTFFPQFEDQFIIDCTGDIIEEAGVKYKFEEYKSIG